jgi:hypothetical protein
VSANKGAVQNITVLSNEIYFSIGLSSGEVKKSFTSKVPIAGNISTSAGIKKIKLEAISDRVVIT